PPPAKLSPRRLPLVPRLDRFGHERTSLQAPLRSELSNHVSFRASFELRNNFRWQLFSKFGVSFSNSNQIQFVLFALAQSSLSIAPRPNFPLDDVLQVRHRHQLSEDLFRLRAGNEVLVTRVLRSEEHTSELQSQSNLVC